MLLSAKKRTEQSDAELLELFLHTERSEYLGELYNRYIPLVYGLCLKYLKSAEDAEDAVMQIFESLLDKVGRFEIREFRTWLYSVARNHCLQILRRSTREISTDFSTVVVESDAETHLFDRQQQEVRAGALQRCMEQLPVPQRESVRLFFFEEKSYTEVAAITSYHLKSVKSYIQNGKRNLKICLEKQGIKQ
jgi:RNA polymerase sigma-70 factor (ECF subfamily)